MAPPGVGFFLLNWSPKSTRFCVELFVGEGGGWGGWSCCLIFQMRLKRTIHKYVVCRPKRHIVLCCYRFTLNGDVYEITLFAQLLLPTVLLLTYTSDFCSPASLKSLAYEHIKTAEQRTLIQQYGDWYAGRWWVSCYIWYSEEGPERAGAPLSPLLAVGAYQM